MTGKSLPVLGASLWILGLILFLIGLNLHSATGTWMTTVGSISFLVGLGLEGVWWMKRPRESKTQEKE